MQQIVLRTVQRMRGQVGDRVQAGLQRAPPRDRVGVQWPKGQRQAPRQQDWTVRQVADAELTLCASVTMAICRGGE
ncbi:MAG TPA: hypothetical protein DCY18_00645 [Thauera sp.]|nr:hypothetical protein [Thauera sp.]HAY08440.1 hypothetical protein [Thauera sp.]